MRVLPLRALVVFVLGAFAAVATPASAQQPRQVAAPGAEVAAGARRLPEPRASAVTTRGAFLPVSFARAPDGRVTFEVDVPVEAGGRLTLLPIVDDGVAWTVAVAPPEGTFVVESGAPIAVSTDRDGDWRVRVDAPAGAAPGRLAVLGEGPTRLSVHTSTHETFVGERAALLAWLHAPDDTRPRPGSTIAAEVVLEHASGPFASWPMLDDGRHGDGAAGDGLYGAWLPTAEPGDLRARAVLRGVDADGHAVLRAAAVVVAVRERAARLTGEVTLAPDGDLGVRVELGVARLAQTAKLHVSAELWGVDERGDDVAVCWLSRMVETSDATTTSLPLWLDRRWLDVAAARAPFSLREVRVQDPDTHLPFDRLARVPLGGVTLEGIGWPATLVSTDMLAGPSGFVVAGPGPGAADASAARPGLGEALDPLQPADRALMLVHGYCADGSPWPPADFTGPLLAFSDPDANRSHDQFAQLIAQTGAGKDSFGIVAHSQGGCAAVHLFTYYESGLDEAVGPRRIQALATPWAGTPLAAEVADLGTIFGAGCGSNFDLSSQGAQLWLAGIPAWARAETWAWTTTNAGSACNFLTSLFLSGPNDGVVEQSKGVLAGANNQGNTTGWCHTTGMSEPAAYFDAARNAEMDAAAAR